MKKTAIAPSNIAFIKYWGRKDEILRLPTNGSISMNLSNLLTTTTVSFDSNQSEDTVIFNGKKESLVENRAIMHINRIRKIAHMDTKVRIVTQNNFPTSTGLSSSASGFAALTVAAVAAVGIEMEEKDLSILARQGSGSACRSIPDGFIEWKDGDTSETSYAVSLHPQNYWDIVDIVAIVSKSKKDIATSIGHTRAVTSIFFSTRLSFIQQKISLVKEYITKKDFTKFGELIEAEALEFHAILITSHPSLIYWFPQTVTMMKYVKQMRSSGLEVYFTINTGQDVHVICQQKDAEKVAALLEEIDEVQKVIVNYPANGTHLSETHLF